MIDQKITEELMAVARNDWLGWEDDLAKRINEIIRAHDNKVLNAANTAIEYADDDDYSDWKDIAKSEINKLRP